MKWCILKVYINSRNEYSDIDDTGFVWNLYNKMESIILKNMVSLWFYDNQKRNWYNISNWWSSKRVVSAKLNDSLFVSALHNIAIYETVDLELVYDIKYNIKQIRCQTLWVDYLQKEVNG